MYKKIIFNYLQYNLQQRQINISKNILNIYLKSLSDFAFGKAKHKELFNCMFVFLAVTLNEVKKIQLEHT